MQILTKRSQLPEYLRFYPKGFCSKRQKFDKAQFNRNKLNFEIEDGGCYKDGNFLYYKDRWNKVRRIDTTKQTPKDKIRLKFLEKPYRWWINKSPDVQNAIIPIWISIAFGTFIYNTSNYWIEREEARADKARVPEYVNEEVFQEWKQKKEIEAK